MADDFPIKRPADLETDAFRYSIEMLEAQPMPGPLEHRRIEQVGVWYSLPQGPHWSDRVHLEFHVPKKPLTERQVDAIRSILAGEPAEAFVQRWLDHDAQEVSPDWVNLTGPDQGESPRQGP